MDPLTVSQLVGLIRAALEADGLFADLWVEGEVSNFSKSRLGHRYFSLKDERSVMRSVLFKDEMPGLMLEDGDGVLAHGRVTIYPQRGELQFVVDAVYAQGVGLAAAKFEELYQRLEAEGLFSPERKRPLPAFPRRIGVVTSPTGAAIRDIEHVLARRWPMATLVVSPTLVQGERAPAEIVKALGRLAEDETLDTVLVARGGGSAEDLAAFNDEAVARAIFGFPVPVVVGVGHETDRTIADFVADAVAATPSAAAAAATPDVRALAGRIVQLGRVMNAAMGEQLSAEAVRLDSLGRRIEQAAPEPARLAGDLGAITERMLRSVTERMAAASARLDGLSLQLETLNPAATMARGYAVVQSAKTDEVVTSVRDIAAGERLSVAVADGAFWAEVS